MSHARVFDLPDQPGDRGGEQPEPEPDLVQAYQRGGGDGLRYAEVSMAWAPDCADIYATTAGVLSRHTGYDANISRTLLEACVTACTSCGDECAGHADKHEHCQICAEACRARERACRDLLAAIS
ncbi:hypothetical protein AB0H57_08895 [Micromonospora sp. NPDC050686]|uniref:hypothetical protein n=1 Tax=Micromonospora sp. NPDC050686 TaxID=3154631 RepID=UPI0033F57D14